MKKVLLALLLLISTYSIAQVGIGANGELYPLGNFGVTADTYLTGGFRVINDSLDLANIPTLRRKYKMWCVDSSGNIWQLNSKTLSNTGWVKNQITAFTLGTDVTRQGNVFNAANKLLQLNSAGAIPSLDGGLLTGINASNLSFGTIPDTRYSSNVSLLNAVQTATADKTFSGLVTHLANGIGANTDYTKGVAFENTTTATVSNPVEAAPLIRISGKVYSSSSGTGIINGSNAAEWMLQHLPTTGTNVTVDNQLLLKQRIGTNSYATVATFTKDGLIANIVQNVLTLGGIGNNGVLNLKKSADGAITGIVSAQPSGMSIITNYSALTFGTGNYISFGSGDPNNGTRYSLTGGLYITANTLAAATSNSRLNVIGNAYIGATNGTAPSNGLQVEGVSILTGIRSSIVTKTSNYTATATDRTILVDASAGQVTITLPATIGISGHEYLIKKIDANNTAPYKVTVATSSSQIIDGYATYVLGAQYQYVRVQCDNGNWYITGNN